MPSPSSCKQHHPLSMQVTAGWSSAKNKEKTGINTHLTPIAQQDPMENFSQICNVMPTTDLFLQLYGEGGWSQKTNHSKMGNLTQQHRGLAENRVQPTTYTYKKLSNTTAEQKHCLPKGVQGFDLTTGGKTTPLNLLQVNTRKDNCWQHQPHLPTDTTSMTPVWNAPKDARPEKHLFFRLNTYSLNEREL